MNYNKKGLEMVQAIITLGEHEDRVINVVKGKYGLKNKSDAINLIIEKYEEVLLEPELRPEFVKRMKKISKQKSMRVKDFSKRYNIK